MPEPTPDSLRLRALASGLVDAVTARLPPAAALLAGSAAGGVADEHSDLDLLFYYEELPPPDEFRALIGTPEAISESPESFADSYRLAGVEVQTGATLVSRLQATLDRVLAGEDPGEPATKLCIGLLHGRPLHGHPLIERWRARVAAYPDELRRRAVQAGLQVFPSWHLDAMLAARDAALFRREMLVGGGLKLVLAWSALNRVYFTPFQFKRMRMHLDGLALKPERAAERLELLAGGDPAGAAAELSALHAETRSLIAREAPDIKLP